MRCSMRARPTNACRRAAVTAIRSRCRSGDALAPQRTYLGLRMILPKRLSGPGRRPGGGPCRDDALIRRRTGLAGTRLLLPEKVGAFVAARERETQTEHGHKGNQPDAPARKAGAGRNLAARVVAAHGLLRHQ